jgi:transposase
VRACVVDAAGKRTFAGDVACTREALQAFARRHLCKDDRVALGATTNPWAVVDLLKPFIASVATSNPLRTRAIAEAKAKTDKVDAEVLAQLLRCDYLPAVWEPDEKTRRLRASSPPCVPRWSTTARGSRTGCGPSWPNSWSSRRRRGSSATPAWNG